jgi:hypothetical protein
MGSSALLKIDFYVYAGRNGFNIKECTVWQKICDDETFILIFILEHAKNNPIFFFVLLHLGCNSVKSLAKNIEHTAEKQSPYIA